MEKKQLTLSDGNLTIVLVEEPEGGYTTTCSSVPGLAVRCASIDAAVILVRKEYREREGGRSKPQPGGSGSTKPPYSEQG